MDVTARNELEARVRERCEAGDIDGALTAAIVGYGPELFGFLVGLAHDRARADDAFAATCERMWKGLPAFRWTSTLRVWAYQIARNEFLRTLSEVTRANRQVPLSRVPSIQLAFDRSRNSTPVHEKSVVKDRFADLRASLDPEDHMLLGLRIDRRMSWTEIAKIVGSGEPGATTREAANLRKRFERLKERLREQALDR